MRWESLFADLEAQFRDAQRRGQAAEIQELVRVELTRQVLADRLRSLGGRQFETRLLGGMVIHGRLAHAGKGWIVLDADGHEYLIPETGIASISLPANGSGTDAEVDTGSESMTGLGLGSALRALVRDRCRVRLYGTDGSILGEGTLDRASKDFVQLAVHERDQYRRAPAVRRLQLIPLHALVAVRRET